MSRKKILTEIVIFLAGILVLYFGVYKGIFLVLDSGKTLGERQDSLARWENRQSIVQALNNKVKSTTLKSELNLALPVNEKTGDFLSSIQGAAQKSGVAIKNFTPSNNLAEISTSVETSTDAIKVAKLAYYSVDLTAVGSYEKIYDFTVNLEKIERVVQIKQVDMEKTNDDILTTNFNLTVYYLNM